jgi:Flp pilus assembly protein TadG
MSDERGSMAVELAVLTVPLVLVLLFVAALGRLSEARTAVDEAARDAAREASIARGVDQAKQQATTRAIDDLAADKLSCRAPTISVDTTNLRPGGTVTATIVCTVALDDLLLLRVPGYRTIASTAVEVVDAHRGA